MTIGSRRRKLAGALAAVAPFTALAADADPERLGTISVVEEESVVSEDSGAYTVRGSNTATGLELSLRETPQSITVVTRQRLDDQDLRTLDDLALQVTGLTLHRSDSIDTQISARGFDIDVYQMDGVPVVLGRAKPRLSVYDRVELLRGAGGLLNGAGDPGGAFNLVRKRPTSQLRTELTASYGSWNDIRAQADVGGTLFGNVRGRMLIEHEDKDMFYDGGDSRRTLAYGILEMDLGASALLSLGTSYEWLDQTPDWNGLPTYSDGRDIGLPRSTYLDPAFGHIRTRTPEYFAEVRQDFSPDWKLVVAARSSRDDGDYLVANRSNAVDPVTLDGPVLYPYWAQRLYESRSLDTQLSGVVEAFGRKHDIAVGASWNRFTVHAGGTTPDGEYEVGNVFAFDPYSLQPPVLGQKAGWDYKDVTTQKGLWAMTRIRATDRLSLVAGGRYSKWEDVNTDPSDPSYRAAYDTDHFSPYGGIVFDLGTHWSLYGSYAEVFQPQYERDVDGLLKPRKGQSLEAGLKSEWFGGALNTTLAAFDIRQKNRAQQDTSQPSGACDGEDCYVAIGEVKSQGFEAEVAGRVLPGLELSAGYTWNEQEYSRDESSQGKPLITYVPKQMLRLWGSYALPGTSSRWTVGAGVRAQTRTYSEDGSFTLAQGGHAVVSARVNVALSPQWSLALLGDNLFDKRYYESTGYVEWGNFYGEPRSLQVVVRGKW